MNANETTSGIGMIEGSVYRNKFFSVEYTLPEGFSFYNTDQLTAMNSAIIKLHNDQAVLDAFKKGNAFFDMTAVAENNPNVSVVIQIAGSDATIVNEAGYIEAARGKIIDQLNSTGAAVKSDETGTYTNPKTGDKFTAMKLAIETQGAPLYEEILCIKAGDHFMNVTVTASDEVELDSVLSHLTRIR